MINWVDNKNKPCKEFKSWIVWLMKDSLSLWTLYDVKNRLAKNSYWLRVVISNLLSAPQEVNLLQLIQEQLWSNMLELSLYFNLYYLGG